MKKLIYKFLLIAVLVNITIPNVALAHCLYSPKHSSTIELSIIFMLKNIPFYSVEIVVSLLLISLLIFCFLFKKIDRSFAKKCLLFALLVIPFLLLLLFLYFNSSIVEDYIWNKNNPDPDPYCGFETKDLSVIKLAIDRSLIFFLVCISSTIFATLYFFRDTWKKILIMYFANLLSFVLAIWFIMSIW